MDWDAQLALAKSPNLDDCQDILLMKWWPDYADPAGWFSPLLMSSGDSVGYNFCYLDDDILCAILHSEISLYEGKNEQNY